MSTESEFRIVTNRWHLRGTPDPPNASVVGTPLRRAQSLRRTGHLAARWPQGYGGLVRLTGRGRDLLTPARGDPIAYAGGSLEVELDGAQTIVTAETRPGDPGIEGLIGRNAIRGFRAAVEALVPGERKGVTPLASLLDDVPPVSMIGGIAWAQHRTVEPDEQASLDRSAFQYGSGGTIACSGLRPDGYHDQSLDKGIMFPHWFRPAGDLCSEDPYAWHEIEAAADVYFRRLRRMDLWHSGESIVVEAHHRDSVWGPDGNEIALHEYSLSSTVERGSKLLTSIDVTANVLPFPECPAAASQPQKLIGTDVTTLRAGVHKELVGLHACTHLNDMLRTLSDVPALSERILGR